MEGNIVQTFYSLKTPYLAVLKDGSFAIRPYGTPLGDVQEAISGYQWLVRDGKIATEDDSERHPRTSVGLKADGTLVVFVVDGRKENYSAGMTFVELADIMLAAGCVDAINLDGGGSATFASTYQGTTNLELRNQPSDETGERVLVLLALPAVKALPLTTDTQMAFAFAERCRRATRGFSSASPAARRMWSDISIPITATITLI